jgi:type IV secretory pathway VirB3-like protein
MSRTASRTGISITVWGIYIMLTGLLFIIIPHPILALINIHNANNFIVRLAGMLLFFYGYLYLRAGLHDRGMEPFYIWTLQTRCCAIFILTAFVLLRWAQPLVIGFGVFDLGGAAWTYFALKADKQSGVTEKE